MRIKENPLNITERDVIMKCTTVCRARSIARDSPWTTLTHCNECQQGYKKLSGKSLEKKNNKAPPIRWILYHGINGL